MAARGLGKGLDSLIPAKTETAKAKSKATEEAVKPDSVVKISKIEPNPDQPRKEFDEDALAELADSIRQYGLLQPILVQDRDTYYEIIAGERRWRACKLAGLKEVPVIIKRYTQQEIVEISLIENIQREDLNPIEEALAYKRLLEEFSLRQDEVAEKVSKSRTAVTNSIRLLKLSDKVQNMVIDGAISTGHARALLAISDLTEQEEVAEKIVKDRLSVRDVEKLVKELSKPKKEVVERDTSMDIFYKDIEEKLKTKLMTKVSISSKDGKRGKIELEFYSNEDFDRLYEELLK
jgi:ParB family chromosome partitioning protein